VRILATLKSLSSQNDRFFNHFDNFIPVTCY